MKTKYSLKNFFYPRSIAIVGASDTPGKVGYVVARNILKLGYRGGVFLVNPKHTTLFGRRCYRDLGELEKAVDLAIVIVPARFVLDVLRSGAHKAKNYVIISAGFSETGPEGKRREEQMMKLAQEGHFNVLGPNCLGFIIPKLNINASFAGGMPEAGNVAVISQSGALVVALMDIAKREQTGFSHLISVGNKMQLDESDLIGYLLEDKHTKVIGLYLEGIKDGRRFMEAAARAAAHKPIVVLKAGKTEKAQHAISSHTGALAGSDAVMDKAFERCGVVRAENLENFVDLLKLISMSKAPKKNNRVAIVTNAGGPGVLTTDAFLGKEIALADLQDSTKRKLRAFLPEESSVENPVDLLGDAQEDRYEKALQILEKEDIGSVLCVLTPQDQTPVEKIAEKIIHFRQRTKKVVTTIFIGGERVRQAVNRLRISSVNNFSYPDRAVEALDKYYRWSRSVSRRVDFSLFKEDERRKRKAALIFGKLLGSGRKALLFGEAVELMKLYGIKTVAYQNIIRDEVPQIPFPVVLKVDSDTTLHKMDKQGVVVGIRNQSELNAALRKMESSFPGENKLVQPMMEVKTEIIVGMKRDPIFGPVILFGLGGIYTEVFKAVDFLVGPMDKKEIASEILKSRIAFLFRGARGQKPFDLDELSGIIAKLMMLSHENGSIRELDINPLLIYNDQRKASAVDVKIILS